MSTLLQVVTLVALFAAPLVGAQTAQSGAMLAPIVRTENAGGGVVRVVYDLRGATGASVSIALEASNDGGRTFAIRPRTVTGDVGPAVAPGETRTIVWDSTKDVEDLQIDRFVFRVVVSPGGQSVAPTPAASPGARAAAPPAKPAPVKPVPKKGGLSKGALIALAGGGAAAGVGVAISKGSGGGSSSAAPPTQSPSTPPTAQTRTVTSAYSVPIPVAFTNPDGSVVCNYAVMPAGTLTMTLNISASSVTGVATFQGNMSFGATTCTNGSGGPSPTPGTSTPANLGNLAVTGTASSLSFSGTLVGTNGGQPTGLTLSHSFTGALTADTVSGSLTVGYRSETPGDPTRRVGVGTGTVSVTLR